MVKLFEGKFGKALRRELIFIVLSECLIIGGWTFAYSDATGTLQAFGLSLSQGAMYQVYQIVQFAMLLVMMVVPLARFIGFVDGMREFDCESKKKNDACTDVM